MSLNKYSIHQIFYCKYCGKECKNLNSLKQHECRCKENPNRINVFIDNFNKNRNAWNKGLNKETDIRLKKHNDKYRTNQKLGLHKTSGHPHTEETKRKLSISAKKHHLGGYHLNGHRKSIKGWYKNFHCDSTYELVYLIYCLDHNINIKKCDKVYKYFYEGKYHKYYPDFIINNDTIIELKGYHNELVDLKAQSVTDMKYKILYKKDLQKEFNYVYKTYNVNSKTIQTLYE